MARKGGPVTVCVIDLKGGVGKSTIAALLARSGYRTRDLDVLAIDLDPQANLSQGLMHSDYSKFLTQQRPSIVELSAVISHQLLRFPRPSRFSQPRI